MVSDAGGDLKHYGRLETEIGSPALEEIQMNAQGTQNKVESEVKLPAMVWLPRGDYALGLRTEPMQSNEGPDYARGSRTLPRETAGPDFARGLRTLPREAVRPDFARGVRQSQNGKSG